MLTPDKEVIQCFLKKYKVLYINLLTNGKLSSYLADLNNQLVKQTAEREGVTEQLKADNQMERVARMNNIRQRRNC